MSSADVISTGPGPLRDEDIYAFNPVPPKPPRPPRRVWPWVLAGLLAVAVLLSITGAATLAALADGARDGVHIVVNDDDWAGGHLSAGRGLLAGLGVMLALTAALLVIVVVVPLVLAVVLCAVALGLGVALLAVALVVAAATSPLWGLGLLLWLALRPRRAAPATMPA